MCPVILLCCRNKPNSFLVHCHKKKLSHDSLVLLYFALFAFRKFVFSLCIFLYTVYVGISQVISCKDRLQMTCIVSGGALNSNMSCLTVRQPLIAQ